MDGLIQTRGKVARVKKSTRSRSLSGPLLPEDTAAAERYWIKATQLKLGEWKEKYKELTPLEDDGILRVRGRLARSPLTHYEAHPILLPPDHVISKLIIRDSYNRVLHAGRTLCETRRKF